MRKKLEEDKEVAEMRRKTVHKAQPIKNFKPVEIAHSKKSVTVPVSPKFHTSTRLRSRGGSSLSLASDSTFTS